MKIFKVFVIFSIFTTLLLADWQVRWCDANQWEFAISNFGKLAHAETNDAGGFWPRGSGHNYIFGSGIWVGSVLSNGDTVVAVGYDPHRASTEFAPGLPYTNPDDPQWQVYFSSDSNYPLPILSFLDSYCCYNEFDTSYHMPDTFHIKEPLGITVTQRSFVCPKDWADDVVFLRFVIKNDTNYTINDFYAGFCLDFDIGNEAGYGNDRCGFDLPRKLFYGWQEEPEPGWSEFPGMLGLKLLSPCSLAACKRFTSYLEPERDRERYLAMAGYNFQTGVYEPYDTIWPLPDDQRILMTTGLLSSFAPGDSIVLDWALIADTSFTPPSPTLEYKADKAQACYEAGWHSVQVVHPNGGEIISGLYRVDYTAASITGEPLLIDIYLCSEHGEDTVAFEIENYGSFDWFTNSVADCVMGKLMIIAFDTLTFGVDMSDGYFTIDNPGNAPPYLKLISPQNFDTLSGDFDITWFARDPEFHDSLLINIYYKSHYDTTFQIITSNELNDSVYTWNTVPYRNGPGLLVVEACDEEFSAVDTVQVYLFNQILGGPINHMSGLNNCVNLAVLIHQPSQITGYTYELRFLEYRALPDTQLNFIDYYPEYIYEIVDFDAGITVLDTYSLKQGYAFGYDRLGIDDFSPIIDGFSVHTHTENMDKIKLTNFHYDSVKVVVGIYPESLIVPCGTNLWIWWAYRGARLQLDWITHANGGLTLFVTDLDYGDAIPYRPNGFFLPDSAFGWCFARNYSGGFPSDTLRPGYDRYILVSGGVMGINTSTIVPQPNDRWIVYPSECSPPIKGNVYRFTPSVGSKSKTQLLPISFQVYPVPFTKKLTIAYNVPDRQRVKLVIYDVLGRQVKKIKDGLENSGSYRVVWNGADDRNRNVSAGVYFCRFVTEDNYRDIKKFIMVK